MAHESAWFRLPTPSRPPTATPHVDRAKRTISGGDNLSFNFPSSYLLTTYLEVKRSIAIRIPNTKSTLILIKGSFFSLIQVSLKESFYTSFEMAYELLKIITSTISFVTSIAIFLLLLFFGALTTLGSSVASPFQLREEDATRAG
jgi:hypothetical protein